MPDKTIKIIAAGIEVTVTRKNIKNAYIRILPPYGEVRASVPEYMKNDEISAFIGSRMPWIREKRKKYEAYEPKRYLSGETVHLWGEKKILKIIEGDGERVRISYEISGDMLMIRASGRMTDAQREEAFQKILRAETEKRMRELIGPLEKRTGLHAGEWKLRSMTSRWGSCNVKEKRITISTRLAAYPAECLEEVMIHELCHLRVHGHGKDFYALMDRFCPEWRRISRLLKEPMV